MNLCNRAANQRVQAVVQGLFLDAQRLTKFWVLLDTFKQQFGVFLDLKLSQGGLGVIDQLVATLLQRVALHSAASPSRA